MNKKLCLLILCLPFITVAQDSVTTGIKWANDLSWDQVKQRAKQENKYIFLDCYTTWCGPCKIMDQNVYVNDTVGKYFSEKYISIKVQMDKTKKDNEQVQRWYEDAVKIGKEFHIEAYPTLTFLSPNGVVVHKETGFKGVNDFIDLAQSAVKPGKVYVDPYAEYDRLVIAYKQGIKNYDRMVYMIKASLQFDTTLTRQLIKDYNEYVSGLDVEKRYSKDNIEFWSMFVLNSNSQIFHFFYTDGEIIDKVMQQTGYAAEVVDKTIFSELILPFFEQQNKNPIIHFEGMYVGGSDIKTDYCEADWDKLNLIIKEKYNSQVAERNVLAAKREWYERHSNNEAAARVYLVMLKKYPPREEVLLQLLNYKAWDALITITDSNIVNGYISWMKKLVERYPTVYFFLDTYANLLYKAGKRREAIIWQEKAANLSLANGDPNAIEYRLQVEHMKNRQPTYPGKVNWNGIKWVKWENVKFQKEFNVKSFNGEWLSEACMKIKGHNETVLTKSSGWGTIKVSVGDIVIISKVGYIPQEVVIDKTPSLPTIVLQPI